MFPVHPAGAAARHRPPAGRRGEGEGGGGRAGGPAVAAAAAVAAAQQFAAPADGGQGRAVRGGGRGEEGQRRGVHRGQLLLPHHVSIRVHRHRGVPGGEGTGGEKDGRGEEMYSQMLSAFHFKHLCMFTHVGPIRALHVAL